MHEELQAWLQQRLYKDYIYIYMCVCVCVSTGNKDLRPYMSYPTNILRSLLFSRYNHLTLTPNLMQKLFIC
jgi:hypothetical protein